MDIATFTTEALDDLWRPNDAQLQAAMPRLVKRGESRLHRELDIQANEVSLEADVTDNPFVLPDEVDSVRSLQFVNRGPGRYTTPNDFARGVEKRPLYPGNIRAAQASNDLEFTVEGNRLYHRQNASVATPVPVRLVYHKKPAGLEAGDTSLYDEYPDLYRFAVYHQCAIYLREPENIGMYEQLYQQALDSALSDQNEKKFTEGPLKMQMPTRTVA